MEKMSETGELNHESAAPASRIPKVPKTEKINITPPNIQRASFVIVGDAPLVVHAFSQKAFNTIREKQVSGERAKKGQKREPKDFEGAYEASKHVSTEGWCGVPASAFRNALISACRMAGFMMSRAKLSVFVEADGYEANGMGLVKITKGKPKKHESYARNDNGGVDLRARAMWDPGWKMTVRIRFDADQFSTSDIANLLLRAGQQVGICEGRPDSKNSAGMGWGTFTIE